MKNNLSHFYFFSFQPVDAVPYATSVADGASTKAAVTLKESKYVPIVPDILNSRDEDLKEKSKLVKPEVVISRQATKSSYILEAEEFLRKFRQRENINKIQPLPSKTKKLKFKIYAAPSPIVTKSKERSSYLDQAEKILKNIGVRKTSTARPAVYPKEKKEKLGQSKVKAILIDNINTKEGLKEIITKLLKQKLETLGLDTINTE